MSLANRDGSSAKYRNRTYFPNCTGGQRQEKVSTATGFPSDEIQDSQASDAAMRTQTADIAGGGCYIETMLPLPVRKRLIITLWLNSERVHTTAIVRTSDPGSGCASSSLVSTKQLRSGCSSTLRALL